MQEFNIALLAIGLLVLGPLGFGWLRPQGWGNAFAILEEVTLALSLMGTALRLPRGYLRQAWRPFAVMLGLVMPLSWLALGWVGLALVFGALFLRRRLLVFLFRPLLSPLHRPRDALLLGWFGPIGEGALFYAALAQRETGSLLSWQVGSLLVTASVIAHGVSATPFTLWFGRAQRQGRPTRPPKLSEEAG